MPDNVNIYPKLNNLTANNFVFDKIYDTLDKAKDNAANDGVYINRYVYVVEGDLVLQKGYGFDIYNLLEEDKGSYSELNNALQTALDKEYNTEEEENQAISEAEINIKNFEKEHEAIIYRRIGKLSVPKLTITAAINYNKDKFNPTTIPTIDNDSDNSITFSEIENTPDEQKYELSINLPEIGNIAAKGYDLLYGTNRKNTNVGDETPKGTKPEELGLIGLVNKTKNQLDDFTTGTINIQSGQDIEANGLTVSHATINTSTPTVGSANSLVSSIELNNGHITKINTISTDNLTVGKASSADKLSTSRIITADLSTQSKGSFNGSANTTISVTGTLPVNKGGTGVTTSTVTAQIKVAKAAVSDSADKLSTSRIITADLSTPSAGSFDGAAATTISVIGVLPVDKGGTGKDNLKDSASALINALTSDTSAPVDSDYFISQEVNGNEGTVSNNYYRRPISALWSYTKGKMANDTGVNISGTSANVTGTVAIENGGTGVTTTSSLKAFFRESVVTIGTKLTSADTSSSPPYQAYPYAATISNDKIKSTDSVDVYFDDDTLKAVVEGDYSICPNTTCAEGSVTIYCSEPSKTIGISQIIIHHM